MSGFDSAHPARVTNLLTEMFPTRQIGDGPLTAQEEVAEGPFVDGDKTKLDSIAQYFGGLSFTTPALTTIVAADTYVKAAGTTTIQPHVNSVDMPVNNRLRIVPGTPTRHYHIVVQASFNFATGVNQTAGLQLYHFDASAGTGSLVAHSEAQSRVSGADVMQITSHGDLMMSEEDYIELHAAHINGTTNLTVTLGYMFMLSMAL